MTAEPIHPAAWEVRRLLGECTVQRTRRTGPGGQHRNKVETAIVITHQPTSLRGEASERRSQADNHSMAVFRLRKKLALSVRGKCDATRTPSPLWMSRCAGGKITISPSHQDFPTLLAEALDFLQAVGGDVGRAAAALNITSSQVVRFLKLEPAAMLCINERRRQLGLKPLH